MKAVTSSIEIARTPRRCLRLQRGYRAPHGLASAAPMNERPKVMFSKTLQNAEWNDPRSALGDLAEEFSALRREDGGDVIAHGGASFVQALSRESLVDEYRLVINPVALGNGLPLFKDLAYPIKLQLVQARTFPNGAALHVYRPTV